MIKLTAFSGEVPKIKPHLLEVYNAQEAVNCDFSQGMLKSRKGLATRVSTAGIVRSVFTDDGLRWFAWSKATRAFLSPTINDAYNRVYYSNSDGYRVAQTAGMKLVNQTPGEPATYWKVGCSPALTGLAAVASGAATGTPETVVYAATATNIWDEESAPSSTVTLNVYPGQTVALSVNVAVTAGEQALTGINFYRTYAANETTDYILINGVPAPVAAGSASHTDPNAGPDHAVVLGTKEWDPPPAGIFDVCYIGNGMVAGAVGKDLVVSEPYHPHAFPWRMSFPHAIVGIIPAEGGCIVLTTRNPFRVTGARPEQLSQEAVIIEQAAVSNRAAVVGEGVIGYLSNDGIVDVSGGSGSTGAGREFFTRENWRTRFASYLKNMFLATSDGLLFAMIDPSFPASVGVQNGIVWSLDEGAPSLCTLNVGEGTYGATRVPVIDALYVGLSNGFAELGAGSDLTLTWHSKEFRVGRPVSFAAAHIDCAGSFTVNIYADGSLFHTQAVTGETSFRVPSGRHEKWSFKFVGTGEITSFEIGASFQELKSG